MANLSMKSMLVASAAAIGLTGLAAPASAQDVNTQIQNPLSIRSHEPLWVIAPQRP